MSQPENTAQFTRAYASLNAAQKSAVDTIEGPVMVIAGPGTGKTQILTLRIAKILLETDMQPENILALTFTEAGVKAMRERLRSFIGPRAYQVSIYTFHGFAQRLIREHPDAYHKVIGGRVASELDRISIVESILEDTSFKLLRPMGDPLYHVPSILRTLGTLKKEYIPPDAFGEIIGKQENDLEGIEKIHQKGAHKGKVRGEYTKKEKSISKNKELLAVYRRYEALLKERRLYDFEDMIVETVTVLSTNEDMLREVQESYQYVLADEHQDVNGSQNKILELICSFHERPNIFVVGDEKQAIYRFQGASLDNFLYFTDLFKDTKQISLIENYRSGQPVLDAAHSLVAVSEGPLKDLRVPLTAVTGKQARVEVRNFSHQAVEDEWVVKTTKALLEAGTLPQEVAVIVRTNREVEHMAGLLRKAGVAAQASADGDILEHTVTRTILGLIDAVAAPHNEAALFTLLHGSYWGLGVDDIVKIARAKSYQSPLFSVLADELKLKEIGVVHIEEAHNISKTITEARRLAALQPPHRVLEYLLQQSGYLEHIISVDPLESGRVVRRLYDEVEKMVLYDSTVTLGEVSALLNNHRQHRIALNAPYIATSETAVSVMTAHKSKGLEYEAVLIPHLVDSVWGGSRKTKDFEIPITHIVNDDEFDVMDDERRLLYVAMTRAKHKLYLVSSGQNQEGKELVSSRLLAELDEGSVHVVSTASEEDHFNPLAGLQKGASAPQIDTELLRTHLRQRGLSATALNNYLTSPYDYLYRNVLRIPEVQTLSLQFGTAVHGVMEWVSATVAATGDIPKITDVKANLEIQLGRLPIDKNEFVRLHEKGLEALVVYLEHAQYTLAKNAKVEFPVKVILATGLEAFPEVTLTGKLDRLDLNEEGRVVRVVDYKTGKAKTRNEIEGKTKNSKGNYKRQLVFYALMLSLMDDERYDCKTGVLSFVQPDSKGEIREESFTITDEEIEALKREIITVVAEISSGSFLQQPCDPAQSSYCHLVTLLN